MLRTLLLLLPISLLIACAPRTQSAAVAPAAGLVGDYTLTLAQSDLPPSASERDRRLVVGMWGFSFHEGNHFVVTHNGREVVQSAFEVEGNRILLPAEDTGSYACRTPAVYTWQMNNGQLTFTRVQDTCTGRVLALTSRPLIRTP